MKTFRDVISLWKTPDEMAAELGVGIYAARHWKERDCIPQKFLLRVLKAPRVKRAGVTAELLLQICEARAAA
jgi:hypothetical protein